jgi:hypothetical protein
LQRPADPSAQTRRQRLESASRGHRPCGCQHFFDAGRVFVLSQLASQNERQGDGAERGDISSAIEPREAGRARQWNPQLAPVALLRESQLFERRSKHVFDHDEPPGGRDDQTFQPQGAMRDAGVGVLVQEGGRRYQLAQETERAVDVEADLLQLGPEQQVGKPNALDSFGDDGKRRALGDPFDAPHAGVPRRTEGCQAAHALAQGELERWNGRELRTDAEELERLGARRIKSVTPLAKTVSEGRILWRRGGYRCSFHRSLSLISRDDRCANCTARRGGRNSLKRRRFEGF